MGCNVFANGDEIACKAGGGKVIAAFPDVCLSPPSPPAGPVPLPYPDTSFSKDMQNGSKTVMIKGQEVMLKDQSFYKTSPLGDEAATNGLGAGVITHVITGKTYFVAWSQDVVFEGQNVDRHSDLTTSNHASPIANDSAPMANLSEQAKKDIQADICPCCKPDHPLHANKEKMVTEEEYYGLADVKCKNGVTIPADKEIAQEYIKGGRSMPAGGIKAQCPMLFGEGDCKTYFITTQAEYDTSEATYRTNKKAIRTKLDAKAGVTIAHRVPLNGGGCPTCSGNLTPHEKNDGTSTPEACKKAEGTLGKRQKDRSEALRACDEPVR